MLLDPHKKMENDLTLGSVTYTLETSGPLLVAVGVYIDSAKRYPREKLHAISSSLAVESGRMLDKNQVRKEIIQAIASFA